MLFIVLIYIINVSVKRFAVFKLKKNTKHIVSSREIFLVWFKYLGMMKINSYNNLLTIRQLLPLL